ncbi:protein transport protein Sec23A-like [Octopus sinensis]|uniref:Protein transport protein SEC23 n=1 Tax=Octopus sinensis TaxID=2607531 RepID=A0A7E6EIQ5_9MOLL|nr:protein transport protein Sec23A-like [Octopus sinensis]
MVPQFVFHLRRSQFSRTSNNSPDETSYNRHIFMSENVTNSLIMIQPVLKSYSFLVTNNGIEFCVQNAPLDASSIKEDHVLLMDTFFSVLIYFGRAVAYYYDQQLHKRQEYSYLDKLFTVPLEDAKKILVGRFPVARLIQTRHDGSQERFLLNKVNPSRSSEDSYLV